ncbi:hypothetical protein ADK53_21810 [Streptomyces sp. WM6373]|nr:hypothetical protein ADK53_21810 [Streptomyces sp. WM6373]
MSALLRFCVEVLRSGTIQDLGLDAQPDAWEAKLGQDYVDDVRRGRMRRDFGLVELSFLKMGESWNCIELSIQIQRLAMAEVDTVPNFLIEKFGKFESRIKFDDLQEQLATEGIRLDRIGDRTQDPHARFSVAKSGAIVHVLTVEPEGVGRPRIGDVWSISVARDFPRRSAPIS